MKNIWLGKMKWLLIVEVYSVLQELYGFWEGSEEAPLIGDLEEASLLDLWYCEFESPLPVPGLLSLSVVC